MNDIDTRTCEVCKTNFNWNDELAGCLNLVEILDCSRAEINKWQEKNENIDLQNYFCCDCANKTIQIIEGKGVRR
tara:strand:- start:41 stop:265 length:225 start_codon:yes stop_codon:yes gene_type:complete